MEAAPWRRPSRPEKSLPKGWEGLGCFFFWSISPELLFANFLGIIKRQHLSP